MLDDQIFKTVVDSAPLISIDILINCAGIQQVPSVENYSEKIRFKIL